MIRTKFNENIIALSFYTNNYFAGDRTIEVLETSLEKLPPTYYTVSGHKTLDRQSVTTLFFQRTPGRLYNPAPGIGVRVLVPGSVITDYEDDSFRVTFHSPDDKITKHNPNPEDLPRFPDSWIGVISHSEDVDTGVGNEALISNVNWTLELFLSELQTVGEVLIAETSSDDQLRKATRERYQEWVDTQQAN